MFSGRIVQEMIELALFPAITVHMFLQKVEKRTFDFGKNNSMEAPQDNIKGTVEV